eukprot:jgi/Botrbrau1/22037/Bobra.0024s0050.1
MSGLSGNRGIPAEMSGYTEAPVFEETVDPLYNFEFWKTAKPSADGENDPPSDLPLGVRSRLEVPAGSAYVTLLEETSDGWVEVTPVDLAGMATLHRITSRVADMPCHDSGGMQAHARRRQQLAICTLVVSK